MTIVVRSSTLPYPKLFISKIRFITYIVDLESKSPVGSSSSTMAGELAKDLAIALLKKGLTLFAAIRLTAHWEGDQPARKGPLFSKA